MGEILSAEEVESFSEGYDAKDVRHLARSHEALRRDRDKYRTEAHILTRERDEHYDARIAAEAEVTRLREALSEVVRVIWQDGYEPEEVERAKAKADAALSAPKEEGNNE